MTLTPDDWDTYDQASLSNSYGTLNAMINGTNGGQLSGSVTGYEGSFVVAVPAGAYQGLKQITLKAPTSGLPIYQLLPDGESFAEDVTVTLDYSFWLDSGDLKDGDDYEILFMDDASETFVSLSPPALFTADAEDPRTSFATGHFSRWVIDKGGTEG